ncbi:MAG: glucose 1-dehydrogenase [Betaproteobacteria bacterium]|nr:glucose 1-dehydrogenase [Betaproteobacteria bacterium]
MFELTGKTALVTGAGNGIGAAIAGAFAAAGASVVCADIVLEAAEKTAAAIGNCGGRAIAATCNVSVSDEAATVCALAAREFGGLHILVSSAAVLAGDGPVTEVDEANWKSSFDVNVTGAFLMAKHAIPLITASGGGSIIHIASVLAHVGAAGRSAYCAQKGALLMMTKAMAIDHAKDNIRVNSISPGPIATERYMKKFGLLSTADAPRAADTLLGRIGEPRDVAAAAVFLASNASAFITGTDLLVDGGICAR